MLSLKYLNTSASSKTKLCVIKIKLRLKRVSSQGCINETVLKKKNCVKISKMIEIYLQEIGYLKKQ